MGEVLTTDWWMNRPSLVTMSDVEEKPVDWLWEPWIPAGAITIIEGDPGLGKSLLTAALAAAVSSGTRFRPDAAVVGPANVIIMSSEDSLSQTIKPRLMAAGADLSKVHALDGITAEGGLTHPFLDAHAEQIEESIRTLSAKLVIVDPLMAYLSGGVNGYVDQDMRRVLSPLARICRDSGATLIVVRHLRKGDGKAQYQGGGSIGILGAARSCILVSADGQDPTLRVIQTVKNNLSPTPKWMTFRIANRGPGTPPFIRFGDV